MLLFSKKLGRQPTGKPNQRVYAIGDVHGCLSETKELLQKIKIDDDYRSPAKTFLVFLGDLVDRGPDSCGVIEFLKSPPFSFAEPLFIMGNHEEMMVRGLMKEPELLPDWLEYGGYACAESYGVPRSRLIGLDPTAMQYILQSAIPKSHVDFMSGFLESVQFGDFLFTHAGIRPGIPLEQQKAGELRWIRQPFLDYTGDHGVIVVHGHTITDQIEVRTNRIGLDTGAYNTGVLSALCVDETEIAFLDTK